MKKTYLYAVLSVFSLLFLYYCSDENSLNSSANEPKLKQKNSKLSSARASNNYNFTKGGNLNLSASEIESLYQICSSETDFSNIQKVLIYTVGNENGSQPININNLQGLSIYKYKNGFLEHSFYKRNNGIFSEIQALHLKVGNYLPLEQVDFIVRYAGLPTSGLSVYYSLNTNYANDTHTHSNEFNDFMIWEYGTHIKLQNPQLFDSSRRAMQAGGDCFPCPDETGGWCDYMQDSNQGWCHYDRPIGGGICKVQGVKSLLQSDDEFNTLVDLNKTYEIRDQVLSQSLFGNKYKIYYYFSSFDHQNLDFESAVQLGSLLPDIYSAYDKFYKNEVNEIMIDEKLASRITSAINNMKEKNSEKVYFVKILDDVSDDINYLKNKNVGQIKAEIF
jgi:hypothetical protein